MKKILLVLAMTLSLGSFASEQTEIVYDTDNHFAITSAFNQRLLDNFTEKVLTYKDPEMFIHFDTPGGSVIALSKMARIMKSSGIKFTCVASFAASAGFMLFEHCNKRLLLSDGILMSHNWSGGFRGEAPRILTMFYTIQSIVDTLEDTVLSKMNTDKAKYYELINKNLWMTSALATTYAAIDGIAPRVTCSDDLIEERKSVRTFSLFGGGRTVYKSGCPLIQKTYTKRKSSSNKDIYLETQYSLFDIAQSEYKLENANMFYTGMKLK
jgi:ATP-dependent protease ClpP protease subunit